MSSPESKFAKIEVLSPLEEGEPFNKEKLAEEYYRFLEVYDGIFQQVRAIKDSAIDVAVIEQLRVTLTRMRELALKLNLKDKVSWVEGQMQHYHIDVPK